MALRSALMEHTFDNPELRRAVEADPVVEWVDAADPEVRSADVGGPEGRSVDARVRAGRSEVVGAPADPSAGVLVSATLALSARAAARPPPHEGVRLRRRTVRLLGLAMSCAFARFY